MTASQIKKTEDILNEIVRGKKKVFAKEHPLESARNINGLRAMFGESYPDPVRVVCIGTAIDKLSENPTSDIGMNTSVEFCGGTHLHNSGHIGDFVITSEEAIAKGIRRIVALTGPEASKSLKKAENLENMAKNLYKTVENLQATDSSKDVVKKIIDLTNDVSQAVIPYWKKVIQEKF